MQMQPRSNRRGFTLIELMIVVSLLGIIGSMLTAILVRQQRFHRAVATITDARARMRDIATIMPTDLRSISTAADDILAISETAMQFRAFVGASIVCNYADATTIELPPKTLDSDNVLTAWINPPAAGDIAYLYNSGTEDGNSDDYWAPIEITAFATDDDDSWCPSTNSPAYTTENDAAASRYRITLESEPGAQVEVGAPIRFAREVRYSIYQADDNNWYIGFQTCTPNADLALAGECGDTEVLAGPVQPASSDTTVSGLYFVYYNKSGTRMSALSNTDTIARVTIGVRTGTESLLKATTRSGGDISDIDSLRITVGFRNRM